MRKTSMVLILLLLAPAAALAQADPASHLTLCRYEGRPGCDFVDGGLTAKNMSGEYYYKIRFQGSVSVNASCEGTPCNCSLATPVRVIEPAPSVDSVQLKVCALPNCSARSCDNTDCESNPFCSNVGGSLKVSAWSTDGTSWTDIDPVVTIIPSASCSENECVP